MIRFIKNLLVVVIDYSIVIKKILKKVNIIIVIIINEVSRVNKRKIVCRDVIEDFSYIEIIIVLLMIVF